MKNLHTDYLLSLSRRIEAFISSMAFIARWSVLVMLGLGLWNVIGRYLGAFVGFNLSSNRLIEGQWYLFDLFFLLGLSWTLQKSGHVRVDILQNKWESKRKSQVELFGTCFFLLPFAIGVLAISIGPAFHSWMIGELSPDPDGLPRYWVKSLIPFGFFLLSLQGFSEAIKSYTTFIRRLEIDESKKTISLEKSFD